MNKKNCSFSIEILDDADVSVKCIHAIKQVMDYFSQGDDPLSPIGRDRRAVYSWFCERFKIEAYIGGVSHSSSQ